MELEKRGIPTVTFVMGWFESLARVAMKGEGLTDHHLVVLPGRPGEHTDESVAEFADRAIEQVVEALTARAPVYVSRKQS